MDVPSIFHKDNGGSMVFTGRTGTEIQSPLLKLQTRNIQISYRADNGSNYSPEVCEHYHSIDQGSNKDLRIQQCYHRSD